MQEIVPPKLNRDTGMFSLLLSRRNFLMGIGTLGSLLVWTTPLLSQPNHKIFVTMTLGFLLIPFLFDVHGRPLHLYLFQMVKYFITKKKQRIVAARDISDGIIILSNNQFARVYQIEPINLSMSSSEEVLAFKSYMQSALFSLKNPIQLVSIQKRTNQDESLATEIARYRKLEGKLKDQCEKYIFEYQQLQDTMERYFYLVLSVHAHGLDDAKRRLDEEENLFGKLLEQTKVRLSSLETQGILKLIHYILPKSQNVSA